MQTQSINNGNIIILSIVCRYDLLFLSYYYYFVVAQPRVRRAVIFAFNAEFFFSHPSGSRLPRLIFLAFIRNNIEFITELRKTRIGQIIITAVKRATAVGTQYYNNNNNNNTIKWTLCNYTTCCSVCIGIQLTK